jgi:hypothetical protein
MRYDLDGILLRDFRRSKRSCVAITGGVMPLQVISLFAIGQAGAIFRAVHISHGCRLGANASPLTGAPGGCF